MTSTVDVRDLYLGSIESAFKVAITADVELTDQMIPRLSFDRVTWLDASWAGADSDDGNGVHTRTCQITGLDVTARFSRVAEYTCFAKVNNVIFRVGLIRVL